MADVVAQGGGDPERQLRTAIATFIHALAADPRKPRVLFAEATAAGPDAAAHMRTTLRRFAALVAATAPSTSPSTALIERCVALYLRLLGR